MKKLILLIIFISFSANSFEELAAHSHYVKWIGVLPEPYKTLEIEIGLKEADDNLDFIKVIIGGKNILFSDSELKEIIDLELETMSVSHEIYRDSEYPAKKMEDYLQDWVIIRIEMGERYRVERDEGDEKKYYWGKDKAVFMISEGEEAHVKIEKFWPNRY